MKSMRTAALAVVLCLALAMSATAQNVISVDEVRLNGNPISGDTIFTGLITPFDLEFRLRVQVDAGINSRLGGTTNGFEIYSTGPSWSTTEADFLPVWTTDPINFDLVQQAAEYSATGQNDTVGFNNSVIFGDGAPPGFNDVAWTITARGLQIDAFDGHDICIDSVATYAPSNLTWLWNDLAGEIFPTFDGPYCLSIVRFIGGPPVITNAPQSLSGSHCTTLSYDFDADDPEGDSFVFELISGPGQIDPNTGLWTWQPDLSDAGATVTLEVAANDGVQGPSASVNLLATNQAPTVPACPALPLSASVGRARVFDLDAQDDCPSDPQLWSIADNGGAVGAVSIDNEGILTFTPDPADEGSINITVAVSDGVDSSLCIVQYDVVAGAFYAVRIEKDEGQTGTGALQGQFTNVDVVLDNAVGPIGAFDLLIAYDPTALNFSGVEVDSARVYQDCEWEYLQYRLGPFGNCVGACPTGQVRVVGIAETNNGAEHPVQGCDPVGQLFSLRFLVSNDRTLECQYVPIRFFWYDCGDNTLSSETGDTLMISNAVFDYNGIDPFNPYSDDIGPAITFPTLQGHPEECETDPGPGKPRPERLVDFYNGGVDIVCADEIDARGDINLDGLAYTIADAVMLTNYFIFGLQAFADLPGQFATEAAIAASDVNADGLTLTVGDLVYLIRVVVGDAAPFPKLAPETATYSLSENGRISIDSELGAAYLTFAGNVTPTLLVDNMTMEHAFDADENITRVIVYSGPEVTTRETFTGDFLQADTTPLTIDAARYDGTPVTAVFSSMIPETFALEQNYPNPFNPSTTIEFALPVRADYQLTIYNVSGQVLDTFEGAAEAGVTSIEWDGSRYASGVYLYKLTAGRYSETRKMMLLK